MADGIVRASRYKPGIAALTYLLASDIKPLKRGMFFRVTVDVPTTTKLVCRIRRITTATSAVVDTLITAINKGNDLLNSSGGAAGATSSRHVFDVAAPQLPDEPPSAGPITEHLEYNFTLSAGIAESIHVLEIENP